MLGINQLIGFGAESLPANLVTNGDFTGGNTGWSVGTGWSTASGAAVHSGSSSGNLTQASIFAIGTPYKITFTAAITGTFNLWIAGSELIQSSIPSGAFSKVWCPRTAGNIFFEAITSAAVTLDNVSVTVAAGRGPELITNGDFSGGSTGWSLGTGWSVTGGAAVHGGSTTSGLVQASIFTSGKTYEIKFNGTITGTANIWIAGTEVVKATVPTGAYSIVWRATTSGSLYLEAIGTAAVTLDNISVKEVI